MLSASDTLRSRTFLLEFIDWEQWGDDYAADITSLGIEPAERAGFRTFAATHDNAWAATTRNHVELYELGFDVVYTYNLTNAVEARKLANLKQRVVPP